MNILSLGDYFGQWINHKDATAEVIGNAERLIEAVNKLASMSSATFLINPNTKTRVSGLDYGGFRPQSCEQGAPKSKHKQGLAVDLYDPTESIDDWCVLHLDLLKQCGIYIEHPSATRGWSHWSIIKPPSGRIVFYP